MLVAVATDTVLIVGMNIVAMSSSNLIDPNDTTPLDAQNIKDRQFGSKMVLVVEQMQCLTIWTIKTCILIMYNRLTMSLRQNLAVKIVGGYVLLSFVVMEILYLGVWCRPFNQYWAVPPNSTQCNAATNHLITNMVFNISSDIMIIAIPMPVFLSSTLPGRRKAVLCGVFAVGTFTIISAVLNKYYSFTQPFGLDWTFWYIRESSTAIIAANLPLTWTLLQHVFHLKSFHEKYANQYTHSHSRSGFRSNGYGSRNPRSTIRGTVSSAIDRSASEERINQGFASIPLKIYQKREIQISTLPAGPDDHRRAGMSSTDSLPDGLKTRVDVQGGGASHSSRSHGYNGSTSEKSIV
ncbi:hypothetical protein ACRE_003600 [Hapsidospora chrysogenum ATCC 11550]|uniref:Rhodopsin domain-containing protein n=1 Tax=Hapsidospora chrysogenum (strain ATCC 11550 / CBS 779.69 / DSM 880 / IAM 14645 / JCM 23072 / IMI 49137) TaxID=857340 RepID=A0A086THI3_HAPC1|nr:hypothetical protein ACRE_003600 [Hapsidospora chrysogenum ATCC 11550]